MRRLENWQVQYITHANERYGYVEGARLALEGGCRWIQLRTKSPLLPLDEEQKRQTASELQQLCRQYNATFVIDDDVQLVKELNVDGVHLGLNDEPVASARQKLGNRIIGGTANTLEHIRQHVRDGVDYVGCGPFRFTQTKAKLAAVVGLEGYRNIISSLNEMKIDIPMVAIGGITLEDIDALKQVGIRGVAVSGCVLNAQDPAAYMRQLVESINR